MSRLVLNGLDLNGKNITSLADPAAATDAANKQYVDNVAAGLNWKARVRGASTANLAIATALTNGLVHDGVTYATGERILLKNQTTGAENAIYIIAASGAASRAPDANTSAEVRNMIVGIESGTVNADKIFQLVTDNPTLDTTALVFTEFTSGGTTYIAGSGLTESPAGTFNVGAGSGISVTADAVAIDTSVVARKVSFSCVATTNPQTFTHNLGIQDVLVEVRRDSDDVIVMADIVSTDANNVSVNFGAAPTASQYRVTVVG